MGGYCSIISVRSTLGKLILEQIEFLRKENAVHMLMLSGEKNLFSKQVESQYNQLCKMYDGAIPVVLGCTELSVVHGTFKGGNSLTIYDPIECVLENIFKNLHSK